MRVGRMLRRFAGHKETEMKTVNLKIETPKGLVVSGADVDALVDMLRRYRSDMSWVAEHDKLHTDADILLKKVST